MSAPHITVLPDTLVNQIAAGEVIENPASVVKELLENAIDAGATRVTIEIESGGASLIRVTDNGCGMSSPDASRALTRHATSKITNIEDLHSIRTLGFRGEALPSIASVSRFLLETRTPGNDVGTRVAVEGEMAPVEPCACAIGTSVTVKDLFFNVPARLKFQKGERSRTAAIRTLVTRTALAFPELHVTLRTGPKSLSEFPPCSRFIDRAAMLLGRNLADRLYEFSARRDDVGVSGVIGDPDLARPDPSRVILLVNDRPVVDLAIRRAVIQAYSVLLPSGRYPVAVARIELDPSEVDVNVHPRKTEVRFRRHREIAGVVFGAIQQTVSGTPWIRTESGGGGPTVPSLSWARPAWEPPPDSLTGPRETSLGPGENDLFTIPGPDNRPCFADLAYVGQVGNTLLICEGKDTLVLIDQHAAHERINFQRLWKDLETGGVSTEPLLFPEVVHLSPEEKLRLEDVNEELSRIGFDLESYSGDAIAIRSIPSILKGRSAAAAIQDCVAGSSAESEQDGADRIRKVVSTLACHASVRAGDELSDMEVRTLLAAMDGVDLAAYCPHGRQAVVVYPMGTVLRWFGR